MTVLVVAIGDFRHVDARHGDVCHGGHGDTRHGGADHDDAGGVRHGDFSARFLVLVSTANGPGSNVGRVREARASEGAGYGGGRLRTGECFSRTERVG